MQNLNHLSGMTEMYNRYLESDVFYMSSRKQTSNMKIKRAGLLSVLRETSNGFINPVLYAIVCTKQLSAAQYGMLFL